jgi:hypothetical protein
MLKNILYKTLKNNEILSAGEEGEIFTFKKYSEK